MRFPITPSNLQARLALWLIAAALVVALLAAAPMASAKSYDVTQCVPGDPVTPGFVQPYRTTMPAACSPSGLDSLIAFTVPGTQSPDTASADSLAGYQVVVPDSMPNTRIKRVVVVMWIADKLAGGSGDSGDIATYGDGVSWGDTLGFAAGSPTMPQALTWIRAGAPAKVVLTRIRCHLGCTYSAEPTIRLGGVSVTLDDPVPPAVPTVAPTGLLDGTPQHGLRHLVVSAADADSGIDGVQLRTQDDRLISASAPGSQCTFTRPAPCPATRTDIDLPIDTSGFPDGVYRFTLTATDAAGNATTTPLPPITIDNIPEAAAEANGTGGDPTTASIKLAKGAAGRAFAYGAAATLTGRLVDRVGTPISAASIDVYDTVAISGAQAERVTTLTTDAAGGFAYRPDTTGSRSIQFAFAPVRGSAAYAQRATARVAVRARVVFTLTRSTARPGTVIGFRGRIQLAPLPAGGARVVIESRAQSGHGWLTAAIIRTRKGGAFRWSHRFRARAHFRLRARLLAAADVPAARSTSRVWSLWVH